MRLNKRPTIDQAEKAGICKTCIAYHPDGKLLKNGKCFSTKDGAQLGQCTRKDAFMMIGKNLLKE